MMPFLFTVASKHGGSKTRLTGPSEDMGHHTSMSHDFQQKKFYFFKLFLHSFSTSQNAWFKKVGENILRPFDLEINHDNFNKNQLKIRVEKHL